MLAHQVMQKVNLVKHKTNGRITGKKLCGRKAFLGF